MSTCMLFSVLWTITKETPPALYPQAATYPLTNALQKKKK